MFFCLKDHAYRSISSQIIFLIKIGLENDVPNVIKFLDNRLIPVDCIKSKAMFPIKKFDSNKNPIIQNDPQLGEYGIIIAESFACEE